MPEPATSPPIASEAVSRTDELLFRFLHDSESLTSNEMMELAAVILEKFLDRQKYRHIAASAVVC